MRPWLSRVRAAIHRRLPVAVRRALLGAALLVGLGAVVVMVVLPELLSRLIGAAVLFGAIGVAVGVVSGSTAPAPAPRRTAPASARSRLLSDYSALVNRRGSRALMSSLRRTRSRPALEILAYRASAGRLDIAGILTTFEEYRDPTLRPLALETLKVMNSAWLGRLARLLAQQPRSQDLLDAATAFDVLAARGSAIPAEPDFRRYYAQALIAAGRAAEVPALVETWGDVSPNDLRAVADAINPFLPGGADRPLDPWLDLVNREWAEAGIEQVRIEDGAATPLDRVRAEAVSPVFDGPLVTVVVTSYRPGDDLVTSVRSVLASSWQTLEVLVVDDASGPAFVDTYARVAALDERVRVITVPTNGGTYRARNAALDEARGDYVTFQDADDWMHPRRIEVQLRHLEAHPGLPANNSPSVRVTDQLQFGHRRLPDAKVCEPSILLRREVVLERAGYFDLVRKGADAEYRARLGAIFGVTIPNIDGPPLTWQRSRPGSLSFDDLGAAWVHPARRAYRDAFQRWHAEIEAGRSPGRRTRDESTPRAFFAPPEVAAPDGDPVHYDVVFLSNWLDFGSKGGSQRSNEEEVRALVAAGYRVAIAQVEPLWFMHWRFSKLSTRALDLLETLGVGLAQLDTPLSADLVMVRYPPVLQFLDPERSAWSVGRVAIVGNQGPYELDGTDRRYDLATCTARAEEVLGCTPVWIPQGPAIRSVYERLVPSELLDPQDLPPIVEPSEWRVERAPRAGRRPVVGRYSRDAEAKWPESRDEILAAYASSRFDTRIMGGPDTLQKVLGDGPYPQTWQVWPQLAMPVKEFLAGIDFFVYFPHPSLREAYGRAIVEALASGAVVILPRSFEPVFGEAAIYAEPGDVERIVTELFADDAAFERQVATGYAFGERSSRAAYVERIAAMLSGGSA